MPLVFEILKTSKKDFHRFEHQKRKNEICPFSILANFNPLQVDKELKKFACYQITDTIDIVGGIRIRKNKWLIKL